RNGAEMATAIHALLRMGELAGPRIRVITATGAAGIMATDACEDFGLAIGELPNGLAERMKKGMPDWIHIGNPIDIWPLGMIGRDYKAVYRTALTELLKSEDIDAVLGITPDFRSALHPDTEVFDVVAEVRRETGSNKPIAIWAYMGDTTTEERFEAVAGVACFTSSVEEAVQGLSYCRRYHRIRRRRMPSPPPLYFTGKSK
ncbi:MAG: hypothetical protein PHN75_03760, partial [Syntrophales bacterium]|nr:hypothetical protein [Syntrophales bacterium]